MDVVNVLTPLSKLKKGQYNTTGKYPVVDQSETFIAGYSNSDGYLLELNKEVVVFGDHTRNVKYIDFDFIAGADGIKILEAKENLNSKFLYYFLQHTELENLGYSRHFKLLKKIQVPLPPLEKQQEIVDEIEQYQKVIDGARQVVENYKPAIDIEPDSELIELQKISQVGSSKRIFKKEYVNSGVPFYRTKEIVELEKGENISLELFISDSKYQEIKNKFSVPKLGDILISAVGTIGISWVVNTNEKFYFKDGNLIWLKDIDKNYIPEFIKYAFDSLFKTQKNKLIHGAAYNALTIQSLKKFKIPNISIEAQKKLVDKINQEKEIINGNKLLIKINNEKIDNLVNSLYTK
jgi:restriction endonuclease S subunit